MSSEYTRPYARRSFLKAAGAGVAATGLAGCRSGGGGGTDDELTIGVLAPDPDTNSIGASIANSAELAVERLNEEGGVLDRDVSVEIENTEESADAGKSAYQELTLGKGADVTVGVFTSEVLMALMDEIADKETVHLTTGAATPEASALVKEDYETYKYHFRTGPLNGFQFGESLMDFASNNFSDIGWNKIAILVEDLAWTKPIRAVMNERLPNVDVDVVSNRTYAPDTENFSPLYDEIENAGADAAFVAMAHTGNAAVVQWARGKRQFGFGGIHVPSQHPQYYEETSRAAAFTVTQNVATPQSELTENTQPYVEAYRNAFEKLPVYTGYLSYDAVNQWAKAVESAGSVDADETVEALESSSHTGTVGTIEYHGQGHRFAHDVIYSPGKVNPVFQQWQPKQQNPNEGIQEVIYPNEFQTSKYVSPPWLQ